MQRRLLLQGTVAGALVFAGLPVRACEFFASTLRVTHPWTRATPDDATSAIVCMRFDEVMQDERLVGIDTPVATGAELLRGDTPGAIDLPIPRGRETLLSERGTRLRLTGLTMPLEVGRSYPLRLHFETAGLLRVDLTIDYARFF